MNLSKFTISFLPDYIKHTKLGELQTAAKRNVKTDQT